MEYPLRVLGAAGLWGPEHVSILVLMPYPAVRIAEIIQKNHIDIVVHRHFDGVGCDGGGGRDQNGGNLFAGDLHYFIFLSLDLKEIAVTLQIGTVCVDDKLHYLLTPIS